MGFDSAILSTIYYFIYDLIFQGIQKTTYLLSACFIMNHEWILLENDVFLEGIGLA